MRNRREELERIDRWLQRFHEERPLLFNALALGLATALLAAVVALLMLFALCTTRR